MVTPDAQENLDVLLDMLLVPVTKSIRINSKLIRDILDVTEGYLRGALNSRGNYDHTTLKVNATYTSIKAEKLKGELTRAELIKATHREHALPLKELIERLYRSNIDSRNTLKEFLEANLVSVLITKEEQKAIDDPQLKIRDAMPEDWDGKDLFARFEVASIKIKQSIAA